MADMVLADDNFATIVGAVEEGRRIYDNIRKSIQFLLSGNLAEVLAVLTATLAGFTILCPSQLLWINLITDSLPALALGLEDAEGDSMSRPPRDSRDGIFAGGLGVDAIVQGVAIAALTLASYLVGHWLEFGTLDLSQVVADPSLGKLGITMAFLTVPCVLTFPSFPAFWQVASGLVRAQGISVGLTRPMTLGRDQQEKRNRTQYPKASRSPEPSVLAHHDSLYQTSNEQNKNQTNEHATRPHPSHHDEPPPHEHPNSKAQPNHDHKHNPSHDHVPHDETDEPHAP